MRSDPRYIASKVLTNIFLKRVPLNSEFSIASKKISSKKDVQLTKTIIHGVLRLKNSIDYDLKKLYNGNYQKLKEVDKNYLRIGVYQISEMDKVPNYASVHTAVEAAKKSNKKFSKTVNAILMNFIRKGGKISQKKAGYNYSSDIVQSWKEQYSKKNLNSLYAWNKAIPTTWFACAKNFNIEDKRYANFNFTKHPDQAGYIYSPYSRLIIEKLVKKNLLYVQSPSSGLIVKLLNLKKQDLILDACAAPGGKSRQIYDTLNGQVNLCMNELNSLRYNKMREDFSTHKVSFLCKDASKDSYKTYDKILLDVPCSSTGTMQKNPDIRWKKNNYKSLTERQFLIIQNMSKYLRKNGAMVYSTCSLNDNENWKVVDRFLTLNKEFYIDSASNYIDSKYVDKNKCMSIFPPKHKMEGMFAARIIRK